MYNVGISVFSWLFRIVAIFHKKAFKMVAGHRETWQLLKNNIDGNREWLWFHAASLGEFEQGRPIIEKIRSKYPDYAILVTFYSPSGYDVRKNYAGADIVCYLPFDSKKNVRKFLDLVKPSMAFFIKYEFWPNYLYELYKLKVPTYLISGIFRKEQVFFKKWGAPYRLMLKYITHFFVQDEGSVELLKSIGYSRNVTISGDTRFDRVLEICNNARELDIVDSFYKGNGHFNGKILVAGSSWPKDEDIIIPYINEHPELRLIIAPHEVHEDHLQKIEAQLKRPFKRYTRTSIKDAANCDCLIIDCFGLLSSIYRYGDIAYIGGGFGVGIHNTLEAAVYGIPVIFGPNYNKFNEAKNLIACKGGFTVNSAGEFNILTDSLVSNPALLKESGENAGEMVKKGSGGTEIIISAINL